MKLSFFIVPLLFSMNLYADNFSCLPHYSKKISQIHGTIIPSRGAVINSSVGGILSNSTLLALGLSTPAGLIATGGMIVGSGTFYGIQHIRQRSLQKVLELYEQIDTKRGRTFLKTQKYLDKRGFEIDELFKDYIIRGVELGEFCPYDSKKGKYKLLTYKQVLKKYLK